MSLFKANVFPVIQRKYSNNNNCKKVWSVLLDRVLLTSQGHYSYVDSGSGIFSGVSGMTELLHCRR